MFFVRSWHVMYFLRYQNPDTVRVIHPTPILAQKVQFPLTASKDLELNFPILSENCRHNIIQRRNKHEPIICRLNIDTTPIKSVFLL